jgi:multidrug efflux pump subunit AcrA (membrane-fusion protein)
MNTRATHNTRTKICHLPKQWYLVLCLMAVAAGVAILLPRSWVTSLRAWLPNPWRSGAGAVAVQPFDGVADRRQAGHDDGEHNRSGSAQPAMRKTARSEAEHGHSHANHDHEHEGHSEANSLVLSPQARKNIGLRTGTVELQPYVRSIAVPATVIGRPGRSHVEVTAPLGGLVTRVYAIEGEAVEPGQPLFDLRLTHEELVQAQSELLRSAEQLDVELREIRRLEAIVESGAVPGKRLLERQYEKQKIEAVLNAQRQSLLLHGLTEEQIEGILKRRKLVQDVSVSTPKHPRNGEDVPPSHPFSVRTLHVRPGQYVDAGAALCSLMDQAHLYIEGRAFEHDADELLLAAREAWELHATLEDDSREPVLIQGLRIVYVDNEIDLESRALRFYVDLRNEIVHESRSADGHRFVTWRYRPGQRMQLRVPVETWLDRIVLPVDAVAREGAEYYVFQQNGDHFDRVPVQVEYRDQVKTVIADDGSLAAGDTVAISGAHQLQMALKNKAVGVADPHGGHNH